MEVLLIEDEKSKVEAISGCLYSFDVGVSGLVLNHADNLRDARRFILTKKFDLIIFDIYLPINSGGKEEDISFDIVDEFANSMNCHTEAITITRYRSDDISFANLFNDCGITIVEYEESNNKWILALQAKLVKASEKIRFDFVVFCALAKERMAFSESSAILGAYKNIFGLNCQEITIGNSKGLCIVPPRPGLVNMAIVSTKAIELFQPKIVSMSGICAGVQGEVNLLDILVADVCWEYQTGKFKDNSFNQEPYQSSITPSVKTELSQRAEDAEFVSSLKKDLFETELRYSCVRIVPMSSGSAVIAESSMMERIGAQHRKMAGLEMEMYSLYEAAHQSLCEPAVFGAKSVVDMGDSSKGDVFHNTACVLSARFVARYIADFFQ